MPASLFQRLVTKLSSDAAFVQPVPRVQDVPSALKREVCGRLPAEPITPAAPHGVPGVPSANSPDLLGTPGTQAGTKGVLDKTKGFRRENTWNTENTSNKEGAASSETAPGMHGAWGASDDERAAIVEFDAKIPRDWAEGFARLDAGLPPGDVPVRRWETFVSDIGRFLDDGWAHKAAAIGWGPLDLFGCDRQRPFAWIDKCGLLWLLNGDKLVEMDRHKAVIERQTGSRQTYRRKPVSVGEVVVPWELVEI